MGQLPVSSTVRSVEDPSVTDGRRGDTLKQTLCSLVPPAFVAVVAFRAYAPKSLTDALWPVIVTSSLITILVLGLEFVHDRHAGWRMNRQEFFTDLFYVVLSSTVIVWAFTALTEDPLKALKGALGITTGWAMHVPFLAQTALAVFLIKFGQYWMHHSRLQPQQTEALPKTRKKPGSERLDGF